MELYDLLARVVETFERLRILYIVTGSVASMAYGEPRLTNDIDVVAEISEAHVPGLVAAFPPDEYYLSEEAIREGIRRQGQFNIIHPASGLKVDVIIRKETPFDRSRFARARAIHDERPCPRSNCTSGMRSTWRPAVTTGLSCSVTESNRKQVALS